MNLQAYRRLADEAISRYSHAVKRIEDEEEALDKATSQLDAATAAQLVLQRVAQDVQQKAHAKIASVVSKCLATVFDEPYEFHIKFERKRGKTEAKLYFSRDGYELESPKREVGGGVIDVASFALRLACLALRQPRSRRVLILDEPFKFVHSVEFRHRIRIMLDSLAEEMKFQIIMVTGIPELFGKDPIVLE